MCPCGCERTAGGLLGSQLTWQIRHRSGSIVQAQESNVSHNECAHFLKGQFTLTWLTETDV